MINKQIVLITLLTLLILPLITHAESPSVLLNEIAWMGTTTSSNDEWIELYNTTSNDIDLTNWKINAADGAPTITLEGTIKANGFFILERSDDDTLPTITADQIYTGSLGNTGENLKLIDNNNNLIDEINAVESWPGGDNTTKQTLQRAADLSWQTSAAVGGSPGQANAESTPPEDSTQVTPENNSNQNTGSLVSEVDNIEKQDIVFNEILPNSKKFDEFFEIKNISKKTIDLTNWQVTTAGGQNFYLPSIIATPNTVLVFYRQQTKLALNNIDETLKLKARNNRIIDQINFKNSLIDQSYSRNYVNDWQWTNNLTPGTNNNLPILPTPPIVIGYVPESANVFEFVNVDASDSFDKNQQPLAFSWDFGDGRISNDEITKTIYTAAGNYQIKLTVITPTASTTKEFKIKIADPNATTSTNIATTTSPLTTNDAVTELPFIFISEFLPNPDGADDQLEFIELFSQEAAPYNLAGWQLDDTEGGSKPYTIPTGTIIKPGQYLVFFRPETKLALNNDTDSIRLLTPAGDIADAYQYDGTKEGLSYVRDADFNWQQTKTPTPGEINVLDAQLDNAPTSTAATAVGTVLGASTEVIEMPKTTNNLKYVVSASLAFLIVGFLAGNKLKKSSS